MRSDKAFLTRIGRSDPSFLSRMRRSDPEVSENFLRPAKADKTYLTRIGRPDKSFLTRVGKSKPTKGSQPGQPLSMGYLLEIWLTQNTRVGRSNTSRKV